MINDKMTNEIKDSKSVADYLKAAKEIIKHKGESMNSPYNEYKKIRIAILSSYTTNNLKEILAVKCFESKILADIYLAGYKQYTQEILNKKSQLYIFEPDLVITNIDIMTLLGDYYYDPYSLEEDDRKALFAQKYDELMMLVSELKQHIKSKIILHNFEIPPYSSYGILETRQSSGIRELVEKLNSDIRNSFINNSQVFIFDFENFISNIGKSKASNSNYYYLGDMKLNGEALICLADEYLAYIKPMLSLNKKCLVLDLDNTLWGGIIGEDGISGIKLGPEQSGKPFYEFQKYIRALSRRGVMLAINSKNNLADVQEVFKSHPYMILKETDFAAICCNWNDKASNIAAISKELNIGPDSLVFMDDDSMNCDLVRKMHPEVFVVHLPNNPAEYVSILKKIKDFNTLSITLEDKNKGVMYAQQRMRDSFSKNFTDMDSYLREMQIEVTFEKANSFNIPRISQLTLKTNQFNLTTKRYLEEKIQEFANSKDFDVFSVSVKDKFGDNGIIGVMITQIVNSKSTKTCNIDSFLMSCRVIGRKIEETMLAKIIKNARRAGIKNILGEYVPTAKNDLAKDLYKNGGFKLTEKHADKEVWQRDTASDISIPDYIKIIEKN